jgi:hypothetical protein
MESCHVFALGLTFILLYFVTDRRIATVKLMGEPGIGESALPSTVCVMTNAAV